MRKSSHKEAFLISFFLLLSKLLSERENSPDNFLWALALKLLRTKFDWDESFLYFLMSLWIGGMIGTEGSSLSSSLYEIDIG